MSGLLGHERQNIKRQQALRVVALFDASPPNLITSCFG
jgi:hypothetical protein